MTQTDRAALEAALGHAFHTPQWLERALTHSSRRPELPATVDDNERLEFLGDAVLALVVSRFLLEEFPGWREGQLSKSRARVVNRASLFQAAQRLDLGRYLELGRGEEVAGGRQKQALLANAYEALIAAIFLDAGLDATVSFVRRTLLDEALRVHGAELGEPDHKSTLQEWLQARGESPAHYRLVRTEGPEHRKRFWVEVRMKERALATAEGDSKKQAEQAAARQALEHLRASKS